MATGQTLTTYDTALKDIFSSGYPKRLFNDGADNYKRFKARGAPGGTWEGKNYIWSVQNRRGTGMAWAADSATSAASLPTPQRTGQVRAQITPKWFYGAVQASGQVMKLSKTNRAAFASQIAFDMEDIITNMAKRLNIASFLDGSGVIGQIAAAGIAGTGTITLRAPSVNYGFSSTAAPDAENRGYGVRYMWDRLQLRAQNAVSNEGGAATTIRSGLGEIGDGAVSSSANTIVLDPASDPIGWANNDFLVLAGSQGNFAQKDNGMECLGLQALVDNGDIAPVKHNVTVANLAGFRSIALEGAGTGTARAITLVHLQSLYDTIFHTSGKYPEEILTTTGVVRKIQDMVQPDVRHVSQELKAGYTTLNWAGGGQPLRFGIDVDATFGTLYMIRPDTFFFPVWQDLDWIDDDGQILRLVAGYHAWVAYTCMALNFGCWAPNQNGVIREIDEDFDFSA